MDEFDKRWGVSRTLAVYEELLGTTLLLGLCALLALGWLWLWSTPLASQALRGAMEDQAGPREVAVG